MINSVIRDIGTGQSARVTSDGALVVGNASYSSAYNATANVINTAFNFLSPEAGKHFIITDILLYANKDVGVNDATITIYTASGPTIVTVTDTVLTTEIKAQTSRDLTGLNLSCDPGLWINIKTDDNTIYATIMGYYVDL